jgi:hypothetical protein
MRPYVAIIIDSFRRAIASRVLYILLGLIVLLLIAIAPFHIRETLDWKLDYRQHVQNTDRLIRDLIERGQRGEDTGVQRIWDQLSSSNQSTVEEIYQLNTDPDSAEAPTMEAPISADDDERNYLQLVSNLNEMILDPSFYRDEDWDKNRLPAEAQALIEQGVETLDQEQSRRLNRLLVGQALPAIQSAAPTSLSMYYLTYELISFSSTRENFISQYKDGWTYIFEKIVISVCMFIALLATSSIIPETFEPGSLNLLLSKPISRWGLYLTKFFGGCALMLICAVLLFGGLWIWMGLAFQFWDPALLWSIPIYVFVFSIYFSVSAFIGLKYRSAITAVFVTLLFWAVCFGVGWVHGLVKVPLQNARLFQPVVTDSGPLVLDSVGFLRKWNPGLSEWAVAQQPAAELPEQMQLGIEIAKWIEPLKKDPYRIPPMVSPDGRVTVGLFHVIKSNDRGHQDFFTRPPGEIEFQHYGKFPNGTLAAFATTDGVLSVDQMGDFRLLKFSDLTVAIDDYRSAKLNAPNVEEPELQDDSGSGEAPANEDALQPPDAESLFQSVGPDAPIRLMETFSVAYNADNEEIAIHQFSKGEHRLVVFRKLDDRYVLDRSIPFDLGTDARIRCFVAYQGNTIVVASGNGQVITFDATTLEEQMGFVPEKRFGIRALKGSRDGRWFGLLYSNDKLWLLDTQQPDELQQTPVTGQGAIASFNFSADSQLCVVDREDRLSCYSPDSMELGERYDATGDFVKKAYRYALDPVYRVFPKPGEFYKLVNHLSAARDVEQTKNLDLIGTNTPPNPYSPLWSGLAFMVFMLLVSCLTFQFKDY